MSFAASIPCIYGRYDPFCPYLSAESSPDDTPPNSSEMVFNVHRYEPEMTMAAVSQPRCRQQPNPWMFALVILIVIAFLLIIFGGCYQSTKQQ